MVTRRAASKGAISKAEVLAWLKKQGSPRVVEGMARYGLPTDGAVGISVGDLQKFAKRIGKNHGLALQLWKSGGYEARLLATLIDDPKLVTTKQMNAWTADFNSWGICDSACFWLFDKTPFAYERALQWSKSPKEFVKRGGFALMASLALHDKAAGNERFLALLPSIEEGAEDGRNFVKKGVSWALRGIGKRNPAMKSAAVKVAKRLASREEAACRWVGKDALRDLER
ncbi:MAG TPA: DNA alkylation repair protein [Terriglobales bacterium]|nr:DNA alkylation repair protein [Terriglobales bacterium]